MVGQLYIDGQDIYASFGLSVVDQGYNELVAWPPMKPVSYNDWHEEDGIQPDLSSPLLDARRCTLRLNGVTSQMRVDALLNIFKRGVYHTIDVASIGRTYRMRYVGCDRNEVVGDMRYVTLNLAEDMPILSSATAKSTITSYRDYTLDGKPFTHYGARILEGSLSSITQLPSVKTNLERSFEHKAGVIYDAHDTHFNAYDATLKVLMRADTLSELWNNYDALLRDMIAPNARYIGVGKVSRRYPCYYLSQQPTRFYATGKIWMEFDLTVKVFANPESI